MSKYSIKINGKNKTIDVDDETPLLWVIRDTLGLKGTKFGCGAGLCGACTVHIDGQAVKSCSVYIKEVNGKSITTIEGFYSENPNHPLFKTWIDIEVSQCGYCQVGQIMTASAMLAKNPKPSEQEISDTMSEILCRCGTYYRIKEAINKIVEEG